MMPVVCGQNQHASLCVHSRQDPNLWVQALSYFASCEKCKDYIAEVLHHIEENHLMPPLMVVQMLADSQYATLNDIKVCDCVRVCVCVCVCVCECV